MAEKADPKTTSSGNRPALALHVPEPTSRPGDPVDFSSLDIGEAGAQPRPDEVRGATRPRHERNDRAVTAPCENLGNVKKPRNWTASVTNAHVCENRSREGEEPPAPTKEGSMLPRQPRNVLKSRNRIICCGVQ